MGFTVDDWKRVLWTFIQAGIAAGLVVLSAQGSVPDSWTGARELGYAVGVAFIAAGISAVKNFFLPATSRVK